MKKLLCCLGIAACFYSQGYSLEEAYYEWNSSKPALTSYEKLKDRWVASLLQECIRSSFEKECVYQNIPYKIVVEEGILPCQFSAHFDANSEIETIEKIKMDKQIDLSEHFNALQSLWGQWIESEKVNFLKKEGFESSFTYEEFLEHSQNILQDLKVEDLMSALEVKKQQITPSPIFQKPAFRNELASHSFYPVKKGWEPSSDSGKGGEPKSEEAKLFFNLPLSDEDKVIIRKIVTSMADKNVLQLLMDKRSMERKGDKIRPVHPMRFIGFVLSDPNLRRCMKLVSKTTFKWSGFLDGYEKRMKEESKAGNLFCYCAGLADLLEVERHVIQRYINQGDYEGLVKHFL